MSAEDTGKQMVLASVASSAKEIAQNPVLLEASKALAELPGELKIENDEDDARWGDVALRMRRGERHVETGLTALFRPVEAYKKALREHFKRTLAEPLAAGVARVNIASTAWRAEKDRRARVARDAAEREAREAAEQAAAAQARAQAGEMPEPGDELEDGFDVAPGVAQVVTAPVSTIVRGGESTTFQRRTLKCTLEDLAEARRAWPLAFVFDESTALQLFKAECAEKQESLDAGVVIGGVRFYNEVTLQRRGR